MLFFKTILLVDDDLAITYYHKHILGSQNITNEILVANDLGIAEEILITMEKKTKEELAPSLIFVDVNMPQYTGFEFIENHKNKFSELKRKGVYTFILTTSPNPYNLAAFKDTSIIEHFFQKPLSEKKLEKINELISADLK